ncbi:MAG: hypothetical protein RMK30_01375 [Anaerolineae bacterium]|nr:hypothetical protein [Anaerolineae bacterium]MDW8101516.1 hypothetical protein [Anaerolineae bacterium]
MTRWGWIGLGFLAICWPLNWFLPGPRTHILFFPLWLGLILVLDSLVFWRKGSSPLSRNPVRFAVLFLLSAPFWWLFELLNRRVQNWHYIGGEFTPLEFFFFASLSFSTVIPAVFEASELVSSFLRKPVLSRWKVTLHPALGWGMLGGGILSLLALLLWPRYFFPFLWIFLFLIVEAINYMLGYKSLIIYLQRGEWRPVISLFGGVLICAFFWEFWNYWSWPKWIYTVPFFDFLHIFEMPLLGYGGYLPFALEIYSFYNLIQGIMRWPGHYIRLLPEG